MAMTNLGRLLASALSLTMGAMTALPSEAAKSGKAKAAARNQATGRNHQEHHDSLPKPNKSGAKGDRHTNGIKQAGVAGKKK
jgi:hypothetical protein